jgi:hypothetical protein
MEVKIRDYTFTVDDSHEAFWSRVKDGEWEPGLLDVINRFAENGRIAYDAGRLPCRNAALLTVSEGDSR